MRKIHTTVRLSFEAGLSARAIARTLRVSPSTVGDYLRRAQVAGLSWPLPEAMDERTLEARLFPGAGVPTPARRAMPDWAHVHTERRRKGVTLSLLWQEYKAEHRDGIQYSRFCERYRAFRQGVDVVMRQSHRAGEKLFVDYAGHTVPVVDRESGELRQAQVFVAVLGASSYIPAYAGTTRGSGDARVHKDATSPRTRGPPGRRRCPTGAPPTYAHCSFSAACPSAWSRTIYARRSAARIATNPTSTPPTPTSPSPTASSSSRHGCAGLATRPKPRSPSDSSSAGFSPRCATAPSSP